MLDKVLPRCGVRCRQANQIDTAKMGDGGVRDDDTSATTVTKPTQAKNGQCDGLNERQEHECGP
jgi:hypothetical protein